MTSPVDPADAVGAAAATLALPAVAPLLDVLGRDPSVWIVGGAVRDVLLGGAPLDVDLAVDGDAAAVAARLATALGGSVVEHDRFGTATVSAGPRSFDLARTRTESYPRPGALPDVAFGRIADDLRRRDFTVNAIAVSLAGDVVAAPGAFSDLAARELRVLHDASFRDDPTRLLRLVRYATRLGFGVAGETAALARSAVDGRALGTVTPSRLGAELRLLLRERGAEAALGRLADSGWGAWLVEGFAFDAVRAAVAARATELLPPEGRRDLLLLAVALLDAGRGGPAGASQSGPPEAEPAVPLDQEGNVLPAGAEAEPGVPLGQEGVALPAGPEAEPSAPLPPRPTALPARLDALGFPGRDRETLLAAADAHDTVARLAGVTRPSEIAALLRGVPVEAVALAGALGAEVPARRWLDELRHVALGIDGDDLLAAGIPQGPGVGRALAAALAAKLDGAAPDRDAELRTALSAATEE